MPEFIAVGFLDNAPHAALADGVFDLDPFAAETLVCALLVFGQLTPFGLFDRGLEIGVVLGDAFVTQVSLFANAWVNLQGAFAVKGNVGF